MQFIHAHAEEGGSFVTGCEVPHEWGAPAANSSSSVVTLALDFEAKEVFCETNVLALFLAAKVDEWTDAWSVRRAFCRLSHGDLVAREKTKDLYSLAVKRN
jgi:hypothetical protein